MRSFAAVKNSREGAEPRPYAPRGSILHRADRVVRPYNRFRNISVGRADHSPPLIIRRIPCEKKLSLRGRRERWSWQFASLVPIFSLSAFFHENSRCFSC